MSSQSGPRKGYTLIEVLVALAIIVIIIALLLPAVQKVREVAARVQCANNMKQVALGIHQFHDVNGRYPPYNGVSSLKGTVQNTKPGGVYGSWIVHILPHIEQSALYDAIAADTDKFSNTHNVVTAPGGPVLTPAVPAVWSEGSTHIPAVPATYNNYTGSLQWVGTTNANGYTVYTQQWVPPRTPDPGTGTPERWEPPRTQISPAVPATYGPPGAPVNGYVSVWKPETRSTVIQTLLCPTDFSMNSAPEVRRGLVYANRTLSGTDGPWAATNYLANWNVLTDGKASDGFRALAQTRSDVGDGLSNTVLLAEAYAWCENRGRTAFMAWHIGAGYQGVGGVHNFGLTYGLSSHQISVAGGAAQSVTAANGLPNPGGNPDIGFMFQIRPGPEPADKCPPGQECCNCLTVQTGHSVMNVALADGSVRTLSGSMNPTQWRRALLPRDKEPVNLD